MSKLLRICVLVSCVFSLAGTVVGQEWTRFRGPYGQGISRAKTIPVKWTDKDYQWKVKLPGVGHSSPVIWGQKVFITSGGKNRGTILALQVSDGKILWQKDYELDSYRINTLNSYATGTPVVDGERVYVFWPGQEKCLLAALDHKGNEAWQKEFGGIQCHHGGGITPILADGLVVFTHEHETERKSSWIAVDSRSGQVRWELERKTSGKNSYSTPCLYEPGGGSRQLLFTSFAHGITSVDPKNGQVIWEMDTAFPMRVVSSPVLAGNMVIGTCGQGGGGKHLIAIRAGTKANPNSAKEVYKVTGKKAPYVSTSLAKDGLLFTFHDRGDISCLRADTGAELWSEKPVTGFFGSPVWVNGNIYCISKQGEVVAFKASEKYELLAVNPLKEKSQATPAIAEEKMYLRTDSHLMCLPGKK